MLDARGIAVPNQVRERINASSDLDELDRGVRRAAEDGSAEDLLLRTGGDGRALTARSVPLHEPGRRPCGVRHTKPG